MRRLDLVRRSPRRRRSWCRPWWRRRGGPRRSPRASTESSLRPSSSLMTCAAGQDGDVAQHLLAAIAEARGLDGQDRDGAAELVHDQRGERLAVDVLGDDQHGLAQLDGLLERRQEVLRRREIFLSVMRMTGVLEDRFHAIGVGHEVGRDVAPVELHALGVFLLEAERLAFLDGDDAVLADLVHDLGDDLADLRVGGARWPPRPRSRSRVVDRAGLLLELGDDGLDALLDAALDDHRVGARRSRS